MSVVRRLGLILFGFAVATLVAALAHVPSADAQERTPVPRDAGDPATGYETAPRLRGAAGDSLYDMDVEPEDAGAPGDDSFSDPDDAAPADDLVVVYDDGSRESVSFAYTRLCSVFNCTGQPALSITGGFDRLGLPIGLTIAGRPFAEAPICRNGQAFEQETRFIDRRPALIGG